MLCCIEVRGGFFGSDSHTARIAEAQANANREKARINKEIEKGVIRFVLPCDDWNFEMKDCAWAEIASTSYVSIAQFGMTYVI